MASGVKKADAFRQLAESTTRSSTPSAAPITPTPVTRRIAAQPRQREQTVTRRIGHARPRKGDRGHRPDRRRQGAGRLAKSEYEHLRDTAGERKKALQAKIDALKA